jgi:2-dehydropantoate 2-reductase
VLFATTENTTMRITTLGAGAVGGYFAGRLAEAGADVTFLVREGRKRQLIERGLTIRSSIGDYAGAVKAITADEISGPTDVLILTCKAYDLGSAIETIRPAVGPQTAILPLLNGLAHMDVLNDAFGREHLLGGLAKIAVTLAPDGAIQHLNDWRYLTFGEQDGAESARVIALKDAFDRTSVLATVTPDILQAMWEKIVHLATAAGMTCLMRANVGEIARADGGGKLMIRFLEANAEIAKREGYSPSDAFLAEYRGLFSDPTSTYTASMLRDIERGGRVEADQILGFMLSKARRHDLDDTLHALAYAHVKAYGERRAAQRL